MTSRIAELAAHLLREGHVDNEPDARLAAIHILLASGASSVDSPRGTDEAAPTRTADLKTGGLGAERAGRTPSALHTLLPSPTIQKHHSTR